MSRLLLLATCGLFCSLSACAPTPAGNKAQTPEDLIASIERTLQELDSYSFDVSLDLEVNAEGMEQKVESTQSVAIKKPNRWAIVKQSGFMGGTSISDGENVTTYVPILSRYSTVPLTDYDSTDLVGGRQLMLLGAAALPDRLMGQGLKDWMLAGVENSKFVESEEINGELCRVAQFEEEGGIAWKVWVDDGEMALLRRFVFTTDASRLAADGGLGEMKLRVTIDLVNWKTNVEMNEAQFAFDPPEIATQVESLFSGMEGEEGPHPLLGEQAPEFTAKDLEGESVELVSHRDKSVVILDFWATWCGPCTAALPIIAEVAEDFADRNVVFYAVNEGESAEEVEAYLTESKLQVPILYDEDATVGELYAVSGIPQTVLIDTKGRVQVVHVGLGGDLKEQLTKELEDILAGKDLASPELEKYEAKKEADTDSEEE